MKKLLIVCAAFILGSSALAETLKVEAITPFSTTNPPEIIQVRAIGEIQLTPDIKINEGDILSGCMTDIKDPKRLKRNATFKYQIKTVTSSDGTSTKVNTIAKYVPPFKLDKVETAKSAALSVGNHFVEGLSMGYRAVEGAIKSENGADNRISSAVENVYDHSVLSYASKGEDVVISTGDIFGLKIHSQDEIEAAAPNYTYE